jgi:hypothetical protein
MSQLYFNWFKMCHDNTPPTVTDGQLLQALQRGMLTEAEYNTIMGIPEEPPTE